MLIKNGIGNQIEEDVVFIMEEDVMRCPIHNIKMEIRTLYFGENIIYCIFF